VGNWRTFFINDAQIDNLHRSYVGKLDADASEFLTRLTPLITAPGSIRFSSCGGAIKSALKLRGPPWLSQREPMNAQVAVWGPPDLAIRYLEHERRIALSRDGNTMKGLVHAIQLASLTKLFGPRARSADAYCGLGQATFRAEVCAASDCVLTARGQRAIVRNSTDELLALPSLI
jgi:hypothetical protein